MEQPPDTFRSPSRPATTGVHRRRRPLLAVAVLGTVLVSGAAGALLVTAGGGGSDARLTAAADRSSAAPSSPEDAGAGTTPEDASPTAPPPSTAPADPPTSAPGRTTRAARNRVTTTPPRTTKRTTKRTTTRTTTRTRTRTTPPRTTTTKTSSPAPAGSLAQQVLALTNAERKTAGCKPLAWDATLAKVAQAHSEDMRDNSFFAHESQDGRSPFDRMKNAGYSFRTAAENIAAGQPTAKSVMDSWMNSAGHRANILNCSLTELGVGVAKGGSYGIYWTQDFGTPA